jgi:group I intron endonuclease
MATVGIYKIRNKLNGKFYIGSSVDISRRFSHHQLDLSKNKHDNPHLQNAWNKYGGENFEFEIVRLCSKINLLSEEQKDLDSSVGTAECYNIRENAKCPVAPGSKRPRWVVEKISSAQKGKPRWTEEQKRQMSIDRKGRKHSPETISKFLNRKSSYENIKKAQSFNVGRVYSDEHKRNISLGKIKVNNGIGAQ